MFEGVSPKCYITQPLSPEYLPRRLFHITPRSLGIETGMERDWGRDGPVVMIQAYFGASNWHNADTKNGCENLCVAPSLLFQSPPKPTDSGRFLRSLESSDSLTFPGVERVTVLHFQIKTTSLHSVLFWNV